MIAKLMQKRSKVQRYGITAFLVVVVIVLAMFIYKKPSVTGKIILGKESIYTENLNIEKNESGTYEWRIKNPGSIKSLKATGSVSSNGTAKIYIEKNGTRQLIFDSTRQLFDVDIHVLPEYKKVFQGDEMLVQIVLFNLRGFGAGNVSIEYAVKDSGGNLIASEQENVYVETQAKFIRKLIIPPELKPATYTALVEATLKGSIVGTGSDTFEVDSRHKPKYAEGLRYYLMGLAALVGLVIMLVLGTHWLGSLKKRRTVAELKEKEPAERKEKLEKELKALEGAFNSKFISDESYNKEKARIENELQKLKGRQL